MYDNRYFGEDSLSDRSALKTPPAGRFSPSIPPKILPNHASESTLYEFSSYEVIVSAVESDGLIFGGDACMSSDVRDICSYDRPQAMFQSLLDTEAEVFGSTGR